MAHEGMPKPLTYTVVSKNQFLKCAFCETDLAGSKDESVVFITEMTRAVHETCAKRFKNSLKTKGLDFVRLTGFDETTNPVDHATVVQYCDFFELVHSEAVQLTGYRFEIANALSKSRAYTIEFDRKQGKPIPWFWELNKRSSLSRRPIPLSNDDPRKFSSELWWAGFFVLEVGHQNTDGQLCAALGSLMAPAAPTLADAIEVDRKSDVPYDAKMAARLDSKWPHMAACFAQIVTANWRTFILVRCSALPDGRNTELIPKDMRRAVCPWNDRMTECAQRTIKAIHASWGTPGDVKEANPPKITVSTVRTFAQLYTLGDDTTRLCVNSQMQSANEPIFMLNGYQLLSDWNSSICMLTEDPDPREHRLRRKVYPTGLPLALCSRAPPEGAILCQRAENSHFVLDREKIY